ncbi:MAG: 4-hydroxy-tetrahydrodipicolinate reductase [Syntrophobacteraceae bacterium]
MTRAAISGIGGRMGSRIAQIVGETDGIELVGGFDHPQYPNVGRDLSEVIGGAPTGMIVQGRIEDVLDTADVIIDFTTAAVSLEHLKKASARGKAMVIGSTGFSREQMEEAAKLASAVPCVLSPNMSIGVNILFKMVADAARLLGDGFDIEIVEAHHRFKKDAPSGTAVKLAQVIAQALGRDLDKVGVYERHGLIGERTGAEIGIQTIRGGDIVGEHTIIFAGLGERIELAHRAHSRDNFARGAIHAAKWVVTRPNGLYDMSDVLGIK